MQLCRQRRNATIKPIEFGSKSSPDKDPYRVYLFRQDKEHKPEAPMCTCMPFLTGRRKEGKRLGVDNLDEVFFACRHIKEAQASTCDWTEFSEQHPGYVYDGKCPKCGGPVCEDDNLGLRTGDNPTVVAKDELTNMEETRKLLAELRGEEYVPLPVPTAHVPVLTAVQKANADPQVIEVYADDDLLMRFVWDEDKQLDFFLPGQPNRSAHGINLNDDYPNVIKEIEWPTK